MSFILSKTLFKLNCSQLISRK